MRIPRADIRASSFTQTTKPHSWIFAINPALKRFCLRSFTACTKITSKTAYLIRQTDGEGRNAHLVELVEHGHRRRPVDTSICDAHAVLESRGPLGGDFLPPAVDVRLDHHAYD